MLRMSINSDDIPIIGVGLEDKYLLLLYKLTLIYSVPLCPRPPSPLSLLPSPEMQFHIPILVALLPSLSLGSPFQPHPPPQPPPHSGVCDCAGTTPVSSPPSRNPAICLDPRLGPVHLPRRLPLSGLLTTYDRLGGLTPGAFLAKWTAGGSGGGYVYPPQNGFVLDGNGNAINGTMVLEVGTLLDRFGSEFGRWTFSFSFTLPS